MMTMTTVRDYLAASGRVTLGDIALHFDSSPEAVRLVLDHWIAKGKVRRLDSAGGCCAKATSSCGCASKPQESYEWAPPPH